MISNSSLLPPITSDPQPHTTPSQHQQHYHRDPTNTILIENDSDLEQELVFMMDDTDLYERELLQDYDYEEQQPQQQQPPPQVYDLIKSHSQKSSSSSSSSSKTVATADTTDMSVEESTESMTFDDIEFFDEHTTAVTDQDDGYHPPHSYGSSSSPNNYYQYGGGAVNGRYHHPYHHYNHHQYHQHHNHQQQYPRSASMTVTPRRSTVTNMNNDIHFPHSSGDGGKLSPTTTIMPSSPEGEVEVAERHSSFVFSGFAKVTPTRRSSAPPATSRTLTRKTNISKKITTGKTKNATGKKGSTDTSSSNKSKKTTASATTPTREKPTSRQLPAQVGVPCKFDILCGQSRICASHTGNRRFQVVLDIYAPRYDAATSKQEKMHLTKEIVACIHTAGGRFLKYKDGLWEEISDVTARDKVSHALRTKVASWKRQQQEKATNATNSSKTSSTSSATTKKPTHRRGVRRGRRSSGSSVATNASDIVTTSFDGNDSASANVMGELMKAQREIFATLTTVKSSSSDVKMTGGSKGNGAQAETDHPLKRA